MQNEAGEALQVCSFPSRVCVRLCNTHVICFCRMFVDACSSVLVLTQLSCLPAHVIKLLASG